MHELDFRKLSGWPFWWIGGVLTVAYLVSLFALFGRQLSTIQSASLGELGSALSGVFAPLAFFWLVVGLLQQGRELRVQVIELKESVSAQQATAAASGSQSRLQNEQYLERMYRLYKDACYDTLFHFFDPPNFTFGDRPRSIVANEAVQYRRNGYLAGNRYMILDLASITDGNLKSEPNLNAEFARALLAHPNREVLLRLGRDFQEFDNLRVATLSSFAGGSVIARTDAQEGFSSARELVDGVVRAIESNPR